MTTAPPRPFRVVTHEHDGLVQRVLAQATLVVETIRSNSQLNKTVLSQGADALEASVGELLAFYERRAPQGPTLTPRQAEIVSIVDAHWREKGSGLSYYGLARTLSISSSAVYEAVEALIKKGVLLADKGKHRTIRLAHPQAPSKEAD